MTLQYLSIAWLLGIAFGSVLGWPPDMLAWLAVLPAGGLVLWRREPQARLISACGLVMVAGALRFSLAAPRFDEGAIAHYNGQRGVIVRGLVADEPDVRDRTINLRLRAQALQVAGRWRDVAGDVLVQVGRYPSYGYGDVLEVQGNLETPPEFPDFSYRAYLAARDIHTMLRLPHVQVLAEGQGNPVYAVLYTFKAHAQATIAGIIPDPEASLLTGILLGNERGIPASVQEAFARTNTAHVIAISGFNIAIIAGYLSQAGQRLFGRRRAVYFVVAGIVAYTVLVGASPSVVRAAIMGGMGVVALHLGRQNDALNAVAVSASLMTLHNPFALWDVGFQLSFAATLGLILLVPRFQTLTQALLGRFLPGDRAEQAIGLVNDAVIVTLAAQVATWPIIVYNFRQLAALGMIANFLVLPAQPAVMIWGGLATIAGLIFQPAGQALGWVAWLFLAYTIRMVEAAAQLPFAFVTVDNVPMLVPAMYYALLLTILSGSRFRFVVSALARQGRGGPITPKGAEAPTTNLTRTLLSKLNWRPSARILLTVGVVVVALVWLAAFMQPDGLLHVVFVDVGQGDGIFITTPGGRQIVVDGGPSPSMMASAVGRRLPFWDRSLDLVVLTHPNEDHLAGLLPLIERYTVDFVLAGGGESRAPSYARWRSQVERRSQPPVVPRAGMRIDLGDGAWVEVLNPLGVPTGDENDDSAVLRLGLGEVTFLLTGDLEETGEELLLRSGQTVQSTVLKVGHHGSRGSSSARFLEAVQPQVAVISVGQNTFGHPAPEVLARLEGTRLFRTDRDGSVEMTTDGKGLWVKTER